MFHWVSWDGGWPLQSTLALKSHVRMWDDTTEAWSAIVITSTVWYSSLARHHGQKLVIRSSFSSCQHGKTFFKPCRQKQTFRHIAPLSLPIQICSVPCMEWALPCGVSLVVLRMAIVWQQYMYTTEAKGSVVCTSHEHLGSRSSLVFMLHVACRKAQTKPTLLHCNRY